MNWPVTLIAVAIGLSLAMSAAWVIAIRTGRSGWIDATWSFSVGIFGAIAALLPFTPDEPTSRQWLVSALVIFWSFRLGLHIAARTAADGKDDPRYSELRRQWGESYRSRLFLFLQIQAATAFILALTVMVAARNPSPGLGLSDLIGVVLFIAAVVGEAVSDRQLTAFRRNPANKGNVCDVGLWSLSRHPNYFFEWLGWLAYPVIALNLTDGYLLGLIALAGPVMMYWLLVHVSGIPPLEEHMLRSRGEKFRRYQSRVNAFWPWPSAKGTQSARDPREKHL